MTHVVIPLEERWREKVIGPWADPSIGQDDCWLWRPGAWISLHGYGRIFVNRNHRSRQAHVVAFELFKGEVPKGKVVMHSCDEPACCNPGHLELGTYQENTRDMIGKGRWAGVVAARALMDYEERVAVDAELDAMIAAAAASGEGGMTFPMDNQRVPETGWQVAEHPLWTSEEAPARTELFERIEAKWGNEFATAVWTQASEFQDAIEDSERTCGGGFS